jgi:hypothetical protein
MSTDVTRRGSNGYMSNKVTRLIWTIFFSSLVLFIAACNTTSVDVRKKQEQSGQQSTASAGQSGGGGGQSGNNEQGSKDSSQDGSQGGDEGIIGESPGQQAGNASSAPPAVGSTDDEDGSGGGPRHVGSAGSGAGHVTPDSEDVADLQDDDIVARQLREQAEQEQNSELKEKLWDEYRRYKAGQ